MGVAYPVPSAQRARLAPSRIVAPPHPAAGGPATTPQDLTATVVVTGSLVRQVGKTASATVTATASMVRSVGKPLTATVAATGSLVAQKVILKALTATVTVTASVVKQVGKALSQTA